MRMLNLSVTLLVPCLLIAFLGCGTEQLYSGDERRSSEVATISGSGVFPFKSVSVVRVDGKELGLTNSNAIVMPGSHIVAGHFYQSYGVVSIEGDGTVTFDSHAGRNYVLKGTRSKGKIILWVEDADTNLVVGGIRPE